MTDLENLALAWQGGDADAGAALLDRYEPLIRHWTRARRHQPRPAAMDFEDVCQEERERLLVLIRAWEPERRPLGLYLKIMFASGARNRARVVRREASRVLDYEHFALVQIADSEARGPGVGQIAESLIGEVDALTPRQRAAVGLTFAGYSRAEAGARMGIGGRAVGHLIERARGSAA